MVRTKFESCIYLTAGLFTWDKLHIPLRNAPRARTPCRDLTSAFGVLRVSSVGLERERKRKKHLCSMMSACPRGKNESATYESTNSRVSGTDAPFLAQARRVD